MSRLFHRGNHLGSFSSYKNDNNDPQPKFRIPLTYGTNLGSKGLGNGSLSRVSAGTYVDPSGVLQTAWGDRSQLIDTDAQNDMTDEWWLQARVSATANSIIADSEQNTHYLAKSNLLTGGSSFVFSGEFKAGSLNWVRLYSNYPGEQHYVFFDLANGVLGSESDAVGGIEALGNGWYRCYMALSITTTSTAYIMLAEADNDAQLQGDGSTVSIYARNIMVEELPSGNVLGPELVTNGGFDSDTTGWTANAATLSSDADGQSGNGLKIVNDGAAAGSARQTITVESGEWYEISFWQKTGTAASRVSIDSSSYEWTGDLLAENITNPSYTQYVYRILATSNSFYLQMFTNSTTAGLYSLFDTVSVKKIPDLALLEPSDYINSDTISAQPRFEAEGLLVEPAATNFLPYSEDFTEWTKQANVVFTENSMVSPDGTLNATKYNLLAAVNRYFEDSVSGNSNGRTFTFSVWIYCDSATTLCLQFLRDTTTDYSDNTHAIAGNSTWTRYTWTHTFSANDSSSFKVRIYDDSGGTGDRFHLFGAQLEESAFATSYIPTIGSAVTRTSESADGTYGFKWTMPQEMKDVFGDSSPSIGTAIIILTPKFAAVTPPSSMGWVSVNNGKALMYYGTGPGRLATLDGTQSATIDYSWSANEELVVAVRFHSTNSDLQLCLKHGGSWYYSTLQDYDGAFVLGSNFFIGWGVLYPFNIKNIVIYDTYLTDTQLEAL